MEDNKFSSRGKRVAKPFTKSSTGFKKKAVSENRFSDKPKSNRINGSVSREGESNFAKKKPAFSDTGFSQKAKPEKKGYYTQGTKGSYQKKKTYSDNNNPPKSTGEGFVNKKTEGGFKKKRAFSDTGFSQKPKPVKSGYYTQGTENTPKKKAYDDTEGSTPRPKRESEEFTNKTSIGGYKKKRAFSDIGFSQKAKPVKSGYYTQGTESKYKKKTFSDKEGYTQKPKPTGEEPSNKPLEGSYQKKRAFSNIGFSQKSKPKSEGTFNKDTERKTFRRKTSNIQLTERPSFRNNSNGRTSINSSEEASSKFVKKTFKVREDEPREENTEKKTFSFNKESIVRRENHAFGKNRSAQPDYNLEKYERRAKKRKKNEEQEGDMQGLIRLNRYISNAGICSRRDADTLIEAGEIKVNGIIITEFGFKVKPTDVVKYGSKSLNREKLIYVLLNKPKDYITTTDDPEGRKTVMDLIRTAGSQRLYPVGRLDRNTTGLLLLTNDGELAEKLTHPSNEIKKLYEVELDKPILNEHFQQILKGVDLEDGNVKVDEMATVSADMTMLGVQIHSGKNRVVRRIFESFGYEVIKLDRVMYAGLTKKETPRGNWRYLSEKEVITLKYLL